MRLSGTSVATPIAAGISALVLEFARQAFSGRYPGLMELVASPRGMRLLFRYMSSSRDNFAYVVPWKLLSIKSPPGANEARISSILQEDLDFNDTNREDIQISSNLERDRTLPPQLDRPLGFVETTDPAR
jgi:hypothetical protein